MIAWVNKGVASAMSWMVSDASSTSRQTLRCLSNSGTNQPKLLAEDARADVGTLIVSPLDGRVQAAAFDYDRRNWKVIDPALEPDLAYLKTVVDGDLEVLSRSRNDQVWTVAYVVSDGPVRLQGATLPLAASVSNVFAGQGQLWIGIRVELGEAAKVSAP